MTFFYKKKIKNKRICQSCEYINKTSSCNRNQTTYEKKTEKIMNTRSYGE